MRILDSSALQVNLNNLGFEPEALSVFNKALKAPYGINLITGPTGSGKSTTLYSALGILNEPGGMAFQIFDQKTVHLLEPRYSTSEPIAADTLAELIDKLDIDDKAQAVRTLEEFNAAAKTPENFDPSLKDGVSTSSLDIEKTNWALKLDAPPFHAYSVTGGITFTFGGLKIDDTARVIGTDWRPLPGLYTCGEMVGGLFHDNYAAGSGLMSGAVFGRIAGRNAAQFEG